MRRAIEWCKRHPWVVCWASFATALLLTLLEPLLARPGHPVVAWGSIGLLLLALASFVVTFVRGVIVSWRKSRIRGVAILIATLVVLAAVAVPLSSNIGGRPRVAKAQTDLRTLASAVSIYAGATGSLPASLGDLTARVRTAKGEPVGPFLGQLPQPPTGWTEYRYERRPNGTFTISTSGDGETVRVP